jgi:3-isopropylmalate/(R)-2-methylmalate dehydratase large subunit
MGQTMTQKILAVKAGKSSVKAGELVLIDIDLAMANDVTGPVAVNVFNQGNFEIKDPNKVCFVLDHFTPTKDIKSAQNCKKVREFALSHGVKKFFEGGCAGVEHAILPEMGIVKAGDAIIGADSHTCTYGALNAFSTGVGSTDMAIGMAKAKAWMKVPSAICFNLTGQFKKGVSGKDLILYIISKIGVDGALYKSMEFVGDGVGSLSMDERFTIANMAIEAGAKNGIFISDNKTVDYMERAGVETFTTYSPDPDANYDSVMNIDLGDVPYMVAFPHLPSNGKTAEEAESLHVKLDQVVIGSCTNGRLSDLRIAANVLKGKKVAKNLRVIIIPATPTIYRQAMDEGLFSIFLDAGCIVSPPTCGPCLGGHMGILADGERAIATTNRNFIGRMGHVDSEVYLASPLVAATSAITGYITAPKD